MTEPTFVVGNLIYEDHEHNLYYPGFKSLFTNQLYKQFDYIYLNDNGNCFVGKIQSIYMLKSKRLTVEVQYFNIDRQVDPENTEKNVFEVVQSIELREVDLSKVLIKPAKVMFVQDEFDTDAKLVEFVCNNIKKYREHVDENESCEDDDDDDDEYDANDSFIATSDDDEDLDIDVDDDDDYVDEEESTAEEYEDEEDEEDDDDDDDDDDVDALMNKENVPAEPTLRRLTRRFYEVFFFFRYLKIEDRVVRAIKPELLDLLISYGCDVRDFESTSYKELREYVLKNYFNSESNEDVLLKIPKYKNVKDVIEQAFNENHLDIYKFYTVLSSN
jgi:hypothetical protein